MRYLRICNPTIEVATFRLRGCEADNETDCRDGVADGGDSSDGQTGVAAVGGGDVSAKQTVVGVDIVTDR